MSRADAELIIHALQDEIAIDARSLETIVDAAERPGLPNFKVINMVSLRRRRPLVFRLFRRFAPWIFLCVNVGQFLVALARRLLSRGRNLNETEITAIYNSENDRRHLAAAEKAVGPSRPVAYWNVRSTATLAAAASPGEILAAGRIMAGIFIALPRLVRISPDLRFHVYDLFKLSLFAVICSNRRDHIFLTSSHYQRWSHILSHLPVRMWLVQHGELPAEPGEIAFPHPYGTIDRFFGYDDVSLARLSHIYSVREFTRLQSEMVITPNPLAATTVFLASSAPFIDLELEFAQLVRGQTDMHLILKPHPAHVYDERLQALEALCHRVAGIHEFPACFVQVSYNSFTEHFYAKNGFRVINMKACGGGAQAFEALRYMLKADHR